MTVTSPCTGVCRLDEQTGWCFGCGRDAEEIAGWLNRSDAARAAVWQDIPNRLTQLGANCRRLDLSPEEIVDFAKQTLVQGSGTWVAGVVGAFAEFDKGPDTPVAVDISGDVLTAQTRNGALRMWINDDVRALTFDPPGVQEAPRIVLAVKRERGRLPVSRGIADLGQDCEALIDDPEARLFDLGLGRREARFMVRVPNGPAMDALRRVVGLPFEQAFPRIAPTLVAHSPTRVVESMLGRIEVQGQIPTSGARSPLGPRTHLLLDQLAMGRCLPVGMDLPPAYLPGAIFFPKRRA